MGKENYFNRLSFPIFGIDISIFDPNMNNLECVKIIIVFSLFSIFSYGLDAKSKYKQIEHIAERISGPISSQDSCEPIDPGFGNKLQIKRKISQEIASGTCIWIPENFWNEMRIYEELDKWFRKKEDNFLNDEERRMIQISKKSKMMKSLLSAQSWDCSSTAVFTWTKFCYDNKLPFTTGSLNIEGQTKSYGHYSDLFRSIKDPEERFYHFVRFLMIMTHTKSLNNPLTYPIKFSEVQGGTINHSGGHTRVINGVDSQRDLYVTGQWIYKGLYSAAAALNDLRPFQTERGDYGLRHFRLTALDPKTNTWILRPSRSHCKYSRTEQYHSKGEYLESFYKANDKNLPSMIKLRKASQILGDLIQVRVEYIKDHPWDGSSSRESGSSWDHASTGTTDKRIVDYCEEVYEMADSEDAQDFLKEQRIEIENDSRHLYLPFTSVCSLFKKHYSRIKSPDKYRWFTPEDLFNEYMLNKDSKLAKSIRDYIFYLRYKTKNPKLYDNLIKSIYATIDELELKIEFLKAFDGHLTPYWKNLTRELARENLEAYYLLLDFDMDSEKTAIYARDRLINLEDRILNKKEYLYVLKNVLKYRVEEDINLFSRISNSELIIKLQRYILEELWRSSDQLKDHIAQEDILRVLYLNLDDFSSKYKFMSTMASSGKQIYRKSEASGNYWRDKVLKLIKEDEKSNRFLVPFATKADSERIREELGNASKEALLKMEMRSKIKILLQYSKQSDKNLIRDIMRKLPDQDQNYGNDKFLLIQILAESLYFKALTVQDIDHFFKTSYPPSDYTANYYMELFNAIPFVFKEKDFEKLFSMLERDIPRDYSGTRVNEFLNYLAFFPKNKVIPKLMKLLKRKDLTKYTRISVLKILSNFGIHEPIIKSFLKEEDPETKLKLFHSYLINSRDGLSPSIIEKDLDSIVENHLSLAQNDEMFIGIESRSSYLNLSQVEGRIRTSAKEDLKFLYKMIFELNRDPGKLHRKSKAYKEILRIHNSNYGWSTVNGLMRELTSMALLFNKELRNKIHPEIEAIAERIFQKKNIDEISERKNTMEEKLASITFSRLSYDSKLLSALRTPIYNDLVIISHKQSRVNILGFISNESINQLEYLLSYGNDEQKRFVYSLLKSKNKFKRKMAEIAIRNANVEN